MFLLCSRFTVCYRSGDDLAHYGHVADMWEDKVRKKTRCRQKEHLQYLAMRCVNVAIGDFLFKMPT